MFNFNSLAVALDLVVKIGLQPVMPQKTTIVDWRLPSHRLNFEIRLIRAGWQASLLDYRLDDPSFRFEERSGRPIPIKRDWYWWRYENRSDQSAPIIDTMEFVVRDSESRLSRSETKKLTDRFLVIRFFGNVKIELEGKNRVEPLTIGWVILCTLQHQNPDRLLIRERLNDQTIKEAARSAYFKMSAWSRERRRQPPESNPRDEAAAVLKDFFGLE